MKIIGVIPARYASSRFPGKPLAKILGKEMLAWVIEGARQSKILAEVLVATDDPRIFDLALRCGAKARMTDSDLPSGTDRIHAAVVNEACDWVLNLQGDEPLLSGALVDQLAEPLLKAPADLKMATLGHRISPEELASPHSVKVLCDQFSNAIYFTRFPAPFSRETIPEQKEIASSVVLKHVGMYAYRKDFLTQFCRSPQAFLEKAEALEQLRAPHLGAKIRVIEVQEKSWGVDTPDDIKKIEALMRNAK